MRINTGRAGQVETQGEKPAAASGSAAKVSAAKSGARAGGAAAVADHHGRAGEETRRTLNVTVLIVSIVAAALIGGIAYGAHQFQIRRLGSAFLDRASRLESENDFAGAADYLHQYLKLEPADAAVQARLARAFDKSLGEESGNKDRAIELYVAAAEANPEDLSLQVRLANLYLEQRRFSQAKERSEIVLQAEPENRDAERIVALAAYGQYQQNRKPELLGDALEAVKDAHGRSPGDYQLAEALAQLYREEDVPLPPEERHRLADAAIETLGAQDPTCESILARRRYRLRYHSDSYNSLAALDAAKAALKIDPKHVGALEAAAESATAAGRLEEAEKFYRGLFEVDPKNVGGYLGLARLQVQREQFDAAETTLRDGLKAVGEQEVSLTAMLAELQISRGKDADVTVRQLAQSISRLRPRVETQDRQTLDCVLAVLQAQSRLKKQDYAGAIPYLKTAAMAAESRGAVGGDLGVTPGQTWRLMATAYAQLGMWDLAASGFEKAVSFEPGSTDMRLAAANAWTAAGRHDLAYRQFRSAAQQAPTSDTWLSTAVSAWNWRATRGDDVSLTPLREAVEAADKAAAQTPLRQPWRLQVLKVRLAAAEAAERRSSANQNPPTEAAAPRVGAPPAASTLLGQLKAMEESHGAEAPFWQELAALYEQFKLPAEADRCIEKLFELAPNSATPYVAKARLLSSRGDAEQAIGVLEESLARLSKEDQQAVRLQLSELYARLGKYDQAREQLSGIDKASSDPFGMTVRSLELAYDAKDWATCKKLEKELRAMESDSGSLWKTFQIRRELTQAESGEKVDLAKVEEMLLALERERGQWPTVQLLKGLLYQHQNRKRDAIEAYEKAIEQGDRRVQIYERLIALLYSDKQITRAAAHLRQLGAQATATKGLATIASSVAAFENRHEDALELARKGVEQNPDDAMSHFWLAHRLFAHGEFEESLAEFERAVQLDPTSVSPWNGLFFFHQRRGQVQEARKVLDRMVEQVRLTDAEKIFAKAQGIELLGDTSEAIALYRQAVEAAPKNAAVRLALAGALMRVDIKEAERELNEVRKLDPQSSEARRALAAILGASQDEEKWRQAISLLKEDTGNAESRAMSQRLLAMLYMRRKGHENHESARQILEKLVDERGEAKDRLLLARVLQFDHRWTAAEQHYRSLCSGDNVSPDYVAEYIDMLLRRGDHDQAKSRLEQLERLEPVENRTFRTIQLRARWMDAQGERAGVVTLVDGFVDEQLRVLEATKSDLPPTSPTSPQAKSAELMKQAGDLYFNLQMFSEAETWFRRRVQDRPDEVLGLIQTLARQGKIQEALPFAKAAMEAERSSTAIAALISSWAVAVPVPPADAQAEQLIRLALESFPKDVELLFAVGNLRIIQQRSEEAATLFNRVLEQKPDHIGGLNNLAMMYGESPKDVAKALPLINKAIDLAGPIPALLDTKAMALVHSGESSKAVPILEQAVAASTDPRFRFHMAIALHNTDEPERAKTALREAIEQRLEDQVLTRVERQLLDKLTTELGLRSTVKTSEPDSA